MHSIDDLRGAFELLGDQAPDELLPPDSAHGARRGILTRSHPVLAALAVAATVVAVASGVAVWQRNTANPAHPAGPAQTCPSGPPCAPQRSNTKASAVPTSFTLSTRPGSGWSVLTQTATPTSERVDIAKSGIQAKVTRYAAAVDVPAYTGEEAVTLNGEHARFVSFASDSPKRGIVVSAGAQIIVVRLDTSGAAPPPTSAIDTQTRYAALALTRTSTTIKLPFRFGTVPSGLAPDALSRSAKDLGGPASGAVAFTDGKPTTLSSPLGVLYVTLSSYLDKTGTTLSAQQVNGHPVYVGSPAGPGLVQVLISDQEILTFTTRPDRQSAYSTTTLIDMARHMTLAPDLGNPDTWFSDHLFPGR